MKNKNNVMVKAAMVLALVTGSLSTQAQWLTSGNTTTAPNNILGTNNATDLDIRAGGATRMYIKNSNGFVGIGTATPGFLLDIQNSGNASMNFKSASGNANILIDRGTSSNSSSVNYRTGGSATWQTGNIGNDNFVINNVALSPAALTVLKANNNVGFGTSTPSEKLDVVGNIKSSGNISAVNFTGSGNIDVSGYVGFGSVEQLTDGGANTIASNSNFVPLDSNTRDLGTTAKRWKNLELAGNTFVGGSATINRGLVVSGGINVASGNISSGGDLYTSTGNGVINCGGDSMSASINVMADAFTAGTSNLNANGDEDLFIGGDLEVVGKGYQTGGGAWGVRSDRRLKKDINNFTDGLDKLMKIRPVTFKYNDLMPNHTDQEYVGIIAQEMQEIAPYMVTESPMGQIVSEDENGKEVVVKQGTNYLSYDPNALWYITVNAIKDQQAIIEKQAEQIAALEAKLNMPSGADNRVNTNNSNSSYRLGQNTPNPFNQSTVINFNCGDATQAQIIIRNLNGNLIKSLEVAGKTQVIINASELAQGTYTYTLEIGNRSVDTKLMVITK